MKFIIGVICGIILHIGLIGAADYRYVKRDLECLQAGQPITCNTFKNAPTWEHVVLFRLPISCWTASGSPLEAIYCK